MVAVSCPPDCSGQCELECPHESWESVVGGGGATCVDCGKYLSKEYMQARASELPYWKMLRDNLAPSISGQPSKVFLDGKDVTDMVGEVRITDPKTGGQKGQKPERHSLRPQHPLDEVARVYGYGAEKYAPHNWRKGYSWSLSLDAHARHVAKFRSGESIDPESGFHHLAHAQFHLDVLMEFERLGLGTDDRVDTQERLYSSEDIPDAKVEITVDTNGVWYVAGNEDNYDEEASEKLRELISGWQELGYTTEFPFALRPKDHQGCCDCWDGGLS